MIQYFLENPIWIAVFAAVLAITVWLCIMAGKASAKRYGTNAKIMEKLKEQNKLTEEFSVLSNELIKTADPERLFKGVGLNLHKRVAKKADIMAEFNSLTEKQKEIYALFAVYEDGGEKLSKFFKGSTQPLTGYAESAVKNVLDYKAYAIFVKEFNAYDSENESVSFIPAEIEKLDSEFAQLVTSENLCKNAGEYIAANSQDFI